MASNFIKIGVAVESLLNKAGLGHVLYEARLKEKWVEIMGEKAASMTELAGLRDWKLKIRVPHAAWRMELHFQQSEILLRANKALGGKWIKEIIFC